MRTHTWLLILLLFLQSGCHDYGLEHVSTETGSSDCGEPPNRLLVDFTVTAATDYWSGYCGPETLALVYDHTEHTWVAETESLLSCKNPAEIAHIRDVKAYFVEPSDDWCEEDSILIDHHVDGYYASGYNAGEYSFECPPRNRLTAFWPDSSLGTDTVYAGDLDSSAYEPRDAGRCDKILMIFTDPRTR